MKRKTLKSDFYKTSAEQFPQTLNILRIIFVFLSLFPPFTFPYENSQTKQVNKRIQLFLFFFLKQLQCNICDCVPLRVKLNQLNVKKQLWSRKTTTASCGVSPELWRNGVLGVRIPIQSIKPLTTNTALWLRGGEKMKTESSSRTGVRVQAHESKWFHENAISNTSQRQWSKLSLWCVN